MAKLIFVPNKNIVHSTCDAIVNTVNCSGVSGKGVALEFKKYFPDNYKYYQELCSRDLIKPGDVKQFRAKKGIRSKVILNAATKDQWHYDSEYKWIDSVINRIRVYLSINDIRHIAIPPLGCGCGNLVWPIVLDKMEIAFRDLTQTIYIYGSNPHA